MTTATTQPTTEAGRRFVESQSDWQPARDIWAGRIAAIEAEAAAAERAAIRAAVEVALDGIYSDACTDVLAILDARQP